MLLLQPYPAHNCFTLPTPNKYFVFHPEFRIDFQQNPDFQTNGYNPELKRNPSEKKLNI